MENDSDNDDVCKKFDDCISAGAEYKAIKESLKIDFDTVQKQIEQDELLKVSEIETKEEPTKYNNNSELKKKKNSSFKNGKTTDEERMTGSETDKGVRTRRGRKRNSDPLDKKSQEKQRHLSDSPVTISDDSLSDCPLHIPVTPEKSNVKNNFIYISSDDESDYCLDISLPEEDDNYEISATVWWKFARFDKFNIRRFQKLSYLFEHYSKLENVDENQILLTLNDVVINPDDTPYSLKLTVANIIEGGVTSYQDSSKQNAASKQQEPTLSEDELELKVQRKGCREPIIIRFLKTQKMKIFMLKCAESLELPMEKLKFSFDGETINSNDTPVDLDLEGGECIDLHILE